MPMTIAQNMLLLYIQFLVFILCFLALVIVSLFKLEKIFKFKYPYTVLKDVLEGLTFFSIHYFKSILISFLSFCFFHTIMKFTMMLFGIPIYTLFKTCILFDDIFFIIRHYVSYVFSIFVV